MLVRPMLDGWEMPRIESIRCLERRRLVGHQVPGLAGDLIQDLGSQGLVVEISGSMQGDEARDGFLEELRGRFAAGEPVPFVADITTATELEQVVVEALEVVETNDWSHPFAYRVLLRQYVEPPEPAAPFDDLGVELEADLDLLADLGLDGLELPGLLAAIPELGDPVAPVKPALDGVEAATGGLKDRMGGFTQVFTGGGGP